MRILIVGATGTIGRPLVAALQDRHDLVLASRQKTHEQVDIS
jgi:nucleoside-diphosphate-sugar epimerase